MTRINDPDNDPDKRLERTARKPADSDGGRTDPDAAHDTDSDEHTHTDSDTDPDAGPAGARITGAGGI